MQILTTERESNEVLITQLRIQHEADRARILKLEQLEETYELRIKNERLHFAERFEKLHERHDKESAARQLLEVELNQLRPPRRSQRNKEKGRFAQCQETSTVNGNGNGTTKKSRVPIPVRPSTPIKSNAAKELSSGATTLANSITSSYSKTTFVGSEPAMRPKSARSVSPGSPTPRVGPAPPKAASILDSLDVPDRTTKIRSWADMVRPQLHGAEQESRLGS